MRLHPKGARPGSHFLLLKDGLSLSRISEVPLCSPLSIFWVCVVCSLHPRMMDPRDNTCNFKGEAGIAWAVQLEQDPGSVGQRLLSPGSEPAEMAALRPRGELAEEQWLLQDFTWPWIGH